MLIKCISIVLMLVLSSCSVFTGLGLGGVLGLEEEETSLKPAIAALALLSGSGSSGNPTYSVGFEALDSSGNAFACGSNLSITTTTGGTGNFTPGDLRFYVSEVKLIDANDQDVSVSLPTDNEWQAEQVALLDFENASGNCAVVTNNGSAATNQTLKISAPAGTYKGIAFTLGLPASVNQMERSAASTPAPLNIASLYWSWTSGYKFMKFEFRDPATDKTNLHIGSTGCTAYTTGATPVQCTNPFRSQVRLTSNQNFNPA